MPLTVPAPGSTVPGAGKLIQISVDGVTNSPGTATSPNPIDHETTLDIDVAGSIAASANIAVYFGPNSEQGLLDGLNEVIYGNQASPCALSISYGGSESQYSSSFLQNAHGYFQELAWLGVTVFADSGDFGSNCQMNDGKAHVVYPASDPFVIACGGTQIETVKSTLVENTWNIDGSVLTPFGATGGGVSSVWPLPTWQSGLQATLSGGSAAALTGRGVPDVSGFAAAGYPTVLYGTVSPTGGTSAVSPLYAGLIAMFVAHTGELMGYINPMLYVIAALPKQTAFRDVNDGGNNEWTGPGITSCPSYISTAGWDACTGLGSIDGNALITALMLQEDLRFINPGEPFAFGTGGEWLNYHNQGGNDTGNSVNLGQINNAAPNDVTLITTACNDNATLAADNTATGNGAVGVFGRSRGTTWSIGVAGESQSGCGVYGIAAGEWKINLNIVGVAGRSLAGFALESAPIEEVVDAPIGVLGQSANGPGVRGHGGSLLKQPDQGALFPYFDAAPGGVFSSGRLQDKGLFTDPPQTVSIDPLPQLRLVPSVGATLPTVAQLGDLFLVIPGQGDNYESAQLYICTSLSPAAAGAVPQWQQVQLGVSLPAGTSV